jgi:ABC-type Fe3+/spermidine/putrescine transport system ATPase subunit
MCNSRPFLGVDSLDVSLGGFSLKNVTLSCARGEYHVLLGPTGSGKSTLLKCILGFHRPEGGRIQLDGREITAELPEHRRIGYVPQDYALFPHLDVEKNLRFGLRPRRIPAEQADSLVDKLCTVLNIADLRLREVRHLSGGERQKVAIGRALATQPKLMLLDEPFSSIDEGARRGLWLELREIVKEVGITTLHVTHNLDEAYSLGQRQSLMIDGSLVQSGSTREIFERPVNERVARYFNYTNIFEGVAEETPGGARIDLGHFTVEVSEKIETGRAVKVCIRQQDVRIIQEGGEVRDSLKRNILSGEITNLIPLREECVMWFKIAGSPKACDLEARLPLRMEGRHQLQEGKKIRVALLEHMITVFPESVRASRRPE